MGGRRRRGGRGRGGKRSGVGAKGGLKVLKTTEGAWESFDDGTSERRMKQRKRRRKREVLGPLSRTEKGKRKERACGGSRCRTSKPEGEAGRGRSDEARRLSSFFLTSRSGVFVTSPLLSSHLSPFSTVEPPAIRRIFGVRLGREGRFLRSPFPLGASTARCDRVRLSSRRYDGECEMRKLRWLRKDTNDNAGKRRKRREAKKEEGGGRKRRNKGTKTRAASGILISELTRECV
jgi:hypothetical protein